MTESRIVPKQKLRRCFKIVPPYYAQITQLFHMPSNVSSLYFQAWKSTKKIDLIACIDPTQFAKKRKEASAKLIAKFKRGWADICRNVWGCTQYWPGDWFGRLPDRPPKNYQKYLATLHFTCLCGRAIPKPWATFKDGLIISRITQKNVEQF